MAETLPDEFLPPYQFTEDNRDAEKSTLNQVRDLLTEQVAQVTAGNNNNRIRISFNSERSHTSKEILNEVQNIASHWRERLQEVDTVTEDIISEIRDQQLHLREQILEKKSRELLEVRKVVTAMDIKLEECLKVQSLIDAEMESSSDLGNKDENEKRPELSRTIDVKFDGEGLVAIQDLVVLHPGQPVIVLSDYMNSCVKCIYLYDNEKDTLKFPESPFYLTKVSEKTVASTFGRLKRIAIFKVFPKLELEKLIDTQVEYAGIQRLSASTFAVTRACAFKNGSIDIIDHSGAVIRSFGSEALAAPYFIDISSCGRILASDSSLGSITCFTGRGNIWFRYRPTGVRGLSCPRGLKQHKDCIYVVDEDSNKVVQLSGTGEFIKDALTSEDGVNIPKAIDIDEDGMLYLSIHERYIKIFQLP